MSVSKVILSSSFLEYPYSPRISSPEAHKQREALTIEQIEYNFNPEHTEVRTIEIAPRKPSFKHALSIHRSDEIYFLAKLIITGVAAYGLFFLSKKCRVSINEISISPAIHQVFITVISSIYVMNLIQKLVSQITSPCTFIQVVSYPRSLSKIALKELKNSKKDDQYCDPYTEEPFSPPIGAPRLIVCGKHVFDLPSLLTKMLQKIDRNGNIPHPLYEPFLYKKDAFSPVYKEFLSSEEKEQFLTDVSVFLSIPKDRLAKCWRMRLTEQEQDKLNQACVQLDQESIRQLEVNFQDSAIVSRDFKFSREDIDFILNEKKQRILLKYKDDIILLKQQVFFLQHLPPAIVERYFANMKNEVEQALDKWESANEGQVAPQ